MKRIRITTADTDEGTVKGLRKLADSNMRTVGKEALIAIQSHVLSESTQAKAKKGAK